MFDLSRMLLLSVLSVSAVVSVGANADPTPSLAPPAPILDELVVGTWKAPPGLQQTAIWPNAAPDMDGIAQPPESVITRLSLDALQGDTSETIWNVSSPTMTVFPPKGINTGAAIIVFPGGGFRVLAVTLEGTEICHWIASKGITCVLSKYRVPKGNHHWDAECKCHVMPDVLRALQDAQRTIRLVRSKARTLHIDPQKIGVMGFSAGGYLGAQVSNIFKPAYAPVDAIDQISSRPDFALLFFPGHLCRAGDTLDPEINVSVKTPPTFLLQAWDDPVDQICNSTLYARALNAANVPTEVHLFATGGHAFGLRRDHSPDSVWPSLVENWLKDIKILRRQ